MSEKLRVGILGATGMVGQRFISLLENHPWFEVTTVAASPRSAGKTYEEAVGGRWKMTTPMPEAVKNLVVMNVNEVEKVAAGVDFVFSAVDMTKDEIRAIEEEYAKTETPVVSNNSAHRWTPDVPMVVPEINPEHFKVIEFQKKRLGTTRGFVAVKPNCSIQSYAPALAAWREFEPYEVVATTYQAISGAGKTFKDWPEMVENIIPYIGGEEEKSEQEPLRILGEIKDGVIEKAAEPVIKRNSTVVGTNLVKMRDGLDPCREGDCLSAMVTTDAMLDYARPKGAVVALINGGNFRAALPVGKITQGDIDNLLPFKDKVLLRKYTGKQLFEAVEHGVSDVDGIGPRMIQASGLRYTYSPTAPVGHRVRSVEVQDKNGKWKPLEYNKVYVAAVGAFLASGGDDHKALAGGIQISNSGLLVADVLKAYLKKKSPISQTPQPRISTVKEPSGE